MFTLNYKSTSHINFTHRDLGPFQVKDCVIYIFLCFKVSSILSSTSCLVYPGRVIAKTILKMAQTASLLGTQVLEWGVDSAVQLSIKGPVVYGTSMGTCT